MMHPLPVSSSSRVGVRKARSRASAADRAGAQYDRVGRQAWALAVSIVPERELAAGIVATAFVRALGSSTAGRTADTELLCDVRRRAIATANSRSTVPAPIAALPEPQRELVELALHGHLTLAELASATCIPPADAAALIATAMGTVGALLGGDAAASTAIRQMSPD
jgi:hypothetical protein